MLTSQRVAYEEAFRAELARTGSLDDVDWSRLQKGAIAAGVTRSTASRWKREVIAGTVSPDDPKATPSSVVELLPSPPATTTALRDVVVVEAFAAAPAAITPSGIRQMLADMGRITATLHKILDHSFHDDGRVKNANMAIRASAELRRTVETLAKVTENVNNMRQLEQFMVELLDEVGKLEPACARRVVERLRAVQSRWAS